MINEREMVGQADTFSEIKELQPTTPETKPAGIAIGSTGRKASKFGDLKPKETQREFVGVLFCTKRDDLDQDWIKVIHGKQLGSGSGKITPLKQTNGENG